MSMDTPPQCRMDGAGRFRDHALSPERMRNMADHLISCEPCRERMKAEEALAQTAKALLFRASGQVDFSRLEARILRRIETSGEESGFRRKWRFLNRFLLPAAAVAAISMLMIHIPWTWTDPDAGPSAIVRSFSGEVDEVLILETPVLKQTVIWYREPGDEDPPRMESPDGGVQES